MPEMRMAELARRSDLSVPTIKYYLREGLLQPGRRTSVNQAVYDTEHLERLRLIRALVTVAGLPLARVRLVVAAVSDNSSVLDAMAVTQDVLVGDRDAQTPSDEALSVLAAAVRDRGWDCEESSPAYLSAARAVTELSRENLTLVLDRLGDYAEAADSVGRIDLESLEGADGIDAAIRGVVLGNVLRRSLLESLVLLAQQHYAKDFSGSAGT